eukprot:GEMP01058853.1.p1 GENE.GEMP01058853.1~~GEMP01058853.1.p1  ORF type:complete len:275 (+),score=43.42 GEMP01058853.1:177-1001(+)
MIFLMDIAYAKTVPAIIAVLGEHHFSVEEVPDRQYRIFRGEHLCIVASWEPIVDAIAIPELCSPKWCGPIRIPNGDPRSCLQRSGSVDLSALWSLDPKVASLFVGHWHCRDHDTEEPLTIVQHADGSVTLNNNARLQCHSSERWCASDLAERGHVFCTTDKAGQATVGLEWNGKQYERITDEASVLSACDYWPAPRDVAVEPVDVVCTDAFRRTPKKHFQCSSVEELFLQLENFRGHRTTFPARQRSFYHSAPALLAAACLRRPRVRTHRDDGA